MALLPFTRHASIGMQEKDMLAHPQLSAEEQ